MKKIQSQRIQYMVQGAMIAAIYAVLTFLAVTLNIAFGPVQFRFSEALTILPVFTPAAIPGLAIGCFLSNLSSPFGVADWIFGTLATLLSALFTYLLRNVRIKNIPFLAPLPPVIFNAVIVGAEIAYFMPEGFSWVGFLSAALSVGTTELVLCYALGLPLAIILDKSGAARKMLKH